MDALDLAGVRKLCRGHVEALHNLLFLLGGEVEPESVAAVHLDQAKTHLDCLTDVICRRP